MIHVFFPIVSIYDKSWLPLADDQGTQDFRSMLKKTWAGGRETKKYSLWYENVNPWHPLTSSAFVEWSLPEKNNSLQKKKAKLTPSSVSCFSVLRGSTMKRFVSTSVSPTFAGCWRDSSRWQRRGQTSKQRYGAGKSHSDTYLGCANGKSLWEEVQTIRLISQWMIESALQLWHLEGPISNI